ncbi:hypothetical protein GCM10007304_41950 [Rhodococcoides trifolii]|uniref:Uncharacterized protein n=1 Tax=Rhodococcoides trifolii TaxID=908250 RepID=A0A917LHD3_9NOCA|nr:hypothetical protein [Rhodococcus trifolii]GGG23691.1 hypothetical protein GCM10007304_41950 [Rhodococcus trifolii]
MDRALQRRTNLDVLRRTHAYNAGRTGAVRAGELLRAAESGARSEGERLLIGLLKSARVTGWVVNLKWAVSRSTLRSEYVITQIIATLDRIRCY